MPGHRGSQMRQAGIAVVYRRTARTRYSIAALIAAVDTYYRRMGSEPPLQVVEDDGTSALERALSLASKGYRVVLAYSLLTTLIPALLDELRSVTREARKHGIIPIAGGPHATGDPLGTIALGFKYVFIGEAERTLPRFLSALEERADVEAGIRGLVVGGDVPLFTGWPSLVDLDEYPPFPYWRGIYAPIEITRGCPYACRFCQVSVLHRARLRHRSPEKVLEIAEILLRSGRRDLRFITPDAFSYMGKERSPDPEAFCTWLDKMHKVAESYGGRIFLGSFPSEVRPEHAAIDEMVSCLAGRVANKRVIIGAQSGSERVLRAINRGHDVETVLDAVETLNKHGFIADVDIILGMPPETEEDMVETIEFAETLIRKYKARIHAHYYLPLPGSPYDLSPPKPVPPAVMKRLNKLLGKGYVYGEWLKQIELSSKIMELASQGIIKGLKGWRLIRVKPAREDPH